MSNKLLPRRGVALVPRFHIPFMKYRFAMLGVSAVLVVVSLVALGTAGLKFGIDFQGGTVIDVPDAKDVTIEQMRAAFDDAGVPNAVIQTTLVQGDRGFSIRSEVTTPDQATADAREVSTAVGLDADAFQVTTIGPGWGKNVTNRAMLALGLSIFAILAYVTLRFDYKMSITAVIALSHDILVTLGIYAIVGREVTPNTIAALLTILGYSLYDTIVVFHRVKENSANLRKNSFMQMANESINEVFVRSLNTTITSLIPVVVMLFFGGETLKDFAFALTIGLGIGAYSSIGIASPLYAMWKEREPKFQALKKKYAEAS